MAIGDNGHDFVPKIMIVDSYGNYVRSLSSHLACLGLPVEILVATDAEATLAKLQREAADLLIIDTGLRGKMDGFDLCRALRSGNATQHIPIILLLGGYLSLERHKGISAGADLLLHRPVVKEELLKMIHLLLAGKFKHMESPRAVFSAEIQPARRLRSVG